MKLNLNNFGKRLKLIKRTKKAKEISELDLFVESVGMMDHCWERSNNLYEVFGLNTLEYEESYYQIIEDLLLIKYGYWKTEIILWYVFGRKDEEGEIHPLVVQHVGGEDEEVVIATPLELWNFLAKIEEQKTSDNNE
jgi:hypothetical protein